MSSSALTEWKIPIALIVLSIVPLLGGIARLLGLVNGAPITPENARFLAVPLPVIIHILAASTFCLLGALQFSGSFRVRRSNWHRLLGRIVALCGVFVGVSGLWMTLYYPIDPQLQGSLLFGVRIAVGVAMVTAIVLAINAILHRNLASHRAWMIRSYALGQGAGTQALIILPWILTLGTPLGLTRDLLMTLAWLINIRVAEWLIRRQL